MVVTMIALLLLGFPMMIPLITAAVIGFYMMFNGFGQMDTLIQQMMAAFAHLADRRTDAILGRYYDSWAIREPPD